MSSSFCQEDPSEATGVSLTSTTWTERKTQSSNGCQNFSSERQAVLMHLLRGDVRTYSACSEFKPSRLQRA
ncbi:unnamed protein product [Pleuronectes platessa]|uniref:Uncharacterized protein n=1 Tax=Pleuronectes platessa TaxID=8262 RepID=A0A9N7YFS3_PLEPL|nr:unnamed protein product [Pleuronectes platessa]